MHSRSLILVAVAGVATLVACRLLPVRVRTTAPAAAPAAAPPAIAAPARPAPPPARTGPPPRPADCPDDLSIRAERTVATRQSSDMKPEDYKRMAWAAGHRSAPADDFLWTEREAIDRVIAIEAAHPELVPAGFRAQVSARPRDRALRLRMAGCELYTAAVRRRASYDAALALLLGSSLDDVQGALLASTRDGPRGGNVTSCAVHPCNEGLVCEPVQRHCLAPEAVAFPFVSRPELEIEEALSRALLARYRQTAARPDSPLGWFLTERAHRCGNQVCSFRDFERDGRQELVRWDIRDGGTVEIRPCKRTPQMRAAVASWELCRAKTGHGSQEVCVLFCDQNGAGESCRFGCYQHCKTESALYFECITESR